MKQLNLTSTPYIIKCKDYSTLTFDLIYPTTYDAKNMFDKELFKQIVMNSSFDYKTEQEFKKAKINKLIIGLNCKTIRYHNNLYIIYSLTIPDPKKVKDFNIEESFEFFYNTIYKPNIINDEFNNKQFEREKEYIKFGIQNSLKRIQNYGFQRFIEVADDIGDLKNNLNNNLDLIENTTAKSLYDYYKKVVINHTPICVVYGNIEEKEVNKLYDKYFKQNKIITINEDYDCYMKLNETTNYVEEVSKFNQSVLYMCYKVKNMKEEDKIYLMLLSDILNDRSTNLVFKTLRIKNNLIYSYNLESYSRYGMFFIESYIEKNNKEKTIEVINELMNELKNEKLIKDCISKKIEELEYNLIETKDSKYYEFDKFIDNLLDTRKSLETIYETYQNIDINEFMQFLNRVKLDTVYFLRGEADETK